MNPGLRKHLHACRFLYAAFFLSASIFVLVCIARNLYPFGTRSILKVDLFHQYAPYLEEFRSRVISGKSLLYSWQTGLGKDFVAQTAYYAASPLNVLYFLFPEKMISEAVAFLVMLKISLSAVSFSFYLREHFQRNDASILLFGLMYAFCAFVTCYYWNIMWLDTVALFPLTALGCERLIRDGRVTLYYAALTLTMVVNFYLAVLVCILITLYAVVYALSLAGSEEGKGIAAGRGQGFSMKDPLFRAAVRFVVVSALCAMSAMLILAPVAAALRETDVNGEAFPAFRLYPNWLQLLSAHFLGARDAVLARNEDMPNVYSGVLPILLLPLYYRCKRIPRREKILCSSLLIFMLLCACISPLDFMIHGLHFPANLPHRYTFVYSFVLLCMAYRGFDMVILRTVRSTKPARPAAVDESVDAGMVNHAPIGAVPDGSAPADSPENSPWPVSMTALVCIAAMVLYEVVVPGVAREIDHVLSWPDILLNVVLMGVYLEVLKAVWRMDRQGIGRKRRRRVFNRVVFPVLVVCVLLECAYSLYQNMYDTADREAYVAYLEDTEEALKTMEGMDPEEGDFYRTDFRRFDVLNEGSLYDFNGFSHFSSLAPGGISMLMEHLGIAAAGNSYRYYDTTPLVDAVCGVKYAMSKGEEFPSSDLVYQYASPVRTGSVQVAGTRRVLPLGFLVKRDVLDWKTEDSQPFEVQNDFLRKAAGAAGDVFTIVPPEIIVAHNMEVEEVNEVGDVFSYYLADPYNMETPPYVHGEFVSDREQDLWLYVDAPNAARFVYEKQDERQDRELSAGRSMIHVGHVAQGERILVDFSLTRRGEFEKAYRNAGTIRLFAAGWNDEVFDEAFEKLHRDALRIGHFEDTRIDGTLEASEDGVLLTSVPYTSGWKVYIDGEPVEKLGIGENGLLGAAVTAGTHEVSLRYSSPFLLPAAVCSALGVLVFFAMRRRLEAF